MRSTDADAAELDAPPELPQRLQRVGGLEVRRGADANTLALSFSSETPVQRFFGYEVLGHDDGECDLEWFRSGRAPLLADHSNAIASVLGVVVSAEIRGGKGRAVVRFGDHAEAQEALGKIRAGLLGNVSVGYSIERLARVGERDGEPVYRATRWTPREISLVAAPADAAVGVGRSAPGASTNHEGGGHMATESNQAETTRQNAPPAQARSATPSHLERERERVSAISQAVAAYSETVPDAARLGHEAIQSGASVEAFRSQLLDAMTGGSAVDHRAMSNSALLGLSRGDARSLAEYSLARVVRAQVTGDWSNAGMEREFSQEIARQAGKQPDGTFVPSAALLQRDLVTQATASSLTGTDHLGGASFIEALRPETQVIGLGATVLPGLQRDVSIGRMTEGASAAWVGEDTAAPESNPTFDAVSLTFKHLTANVRYSRRMAIQGDPSMEAIFRDDLRAEVARGLDAAAIAGAGTATEPRGILNTAGILDVPHGDNGGEMSWATIVGLISAVEGQNAARGRLGFLTNALVKAFMLGTPRVAGTDRFILDDEDGGRLAGHKVAVSNLVPNDLTKGTGTGLSALIFGNWRDLLIAEFGGMDLVVDPYTESPKGNVRITIHSFWDIAVRRTESFAVSKDIALA